MKTLFTFLVISFILTTAQAQETEAPVGSEGASEVDVTLSGNTSSEGFTVKKNNGTAVFRVRGDGNVGIGTTSPTEKLDVSGTVKVSGDFTYNSTKTRYVTVSHAAFDMAMPTTAVHTHFSYTSPSTFIVRTQGGNPLNTCYLSAPIYIPDGATVTRMDARVFDNNSIYNLKVKLIRQTWNSPTTLVMAEVSTSGSPIQTTIFDTSIGSSVINMSSYAYFLLFETKEASTNLGLYNVRITYTVTKAD